MKQIWNWWLSEKSNTRPPWVGILLLVRKTYLEIPTGVKGRQNTKQPSQTWRGDKQSTLDWRTHGS